VVILADAASKAGASLLPQVFVLKDAPGPLFVHAPSGRTHTPETLQLRQAAQAAEAAEYWRRLYVGMTRAEDELYVTGYLTKMGKLDGTWYEAVERALAPEAERLTDAEGGLTALIYPRPQQAAPRPLADAAAEPPIPPTVLSLPPLPVPPQIPVIRPSSAHQAANPQRVYDTTAESMVDAETARKSGIALHALLQHVARLPRADWEKVVEKALAALWPEMPERHAALANKAISILRNPAFATIFGPDSRAEVPFLLDTVRNGSPVRLAGRIDRLVVADGRVLVVDYKSDTVPPGSVSEVPPAYVMQLGLYAYVASQLFPGTVVEAGILWTNLESLMILPQPLLGDSVTAFTMR
jgi:ATP-dependent helicase/nuclease subunit A